MNFILFQFLLCKLIILIFLILFQLILLLVFILIVLIIHYFGSSRPPHHFLLLFPSIDKPLLIYHTIDHLLQIIAQLDLFINIIQEYFEVIELRKVRTGYIFVSIDLSLSSCTTDMVSPFVSFVLLVFRLVHLLLFPLLYLFNDVLFILVFYFLNFVQIHHELFTFLMVEVILYIVISSPNVKVVFIR